MFYITINSAVIANYKFLWVMFNNECDKEFYLEEVAQYL